jgi:hypothetical protein
MQEKNDQRKISNNTKEYEVPFLGKNIRNKDFIKIYSRLLFQVYSSSALKYCTYCHNHCLLNFGCWPPSVSVARTLLNKIVLRIRYLLFWILSLFAFKFPLFQACSDQRCLWNPMY